jgi:hypothetical protein
MSNWLDYPNTSNRFIQIYVRGFVDISGGKLILRNDDASFNRNLFVGNDTSLNNDLFVKGNAYIDSKLVVNNDTIMNNRLFLLGDSSLNSNLFVNYDVSINSRLVVGSDTTINNRLFTNGDVLFSSNLSIDGNILINGRSNATSFETESDYRIKANVQPLVDTDFTIDLLKPVTYINKKLNRQDIGFIAHEVQEQIPFLVRGNKDDNELQCINYNGIIGLLTKEIQELKKQNSLILERLNKAGI